MVATGLIFLIYTVSLFPYYSSLFPLGGSLSVPSKINAHLGFCQYNEKWCCDTVKDTQLQKQLHALNVSNLQCASLLRTILCAKYDHCSAGLLLTGTNARTKRRSCTSASSLQSYQSKINISVDFCSKVWDTCENVSIYNSPFAQPAQGITDPSPSKLTDEWQSKTEFCEAFGESPDDETLCFDGEASDRIHESQKPIPGICIEKIGNGSYISMSAHPDGSDSIFLASQEGKIWLANLPNYGSNGTLNIDKSHPFLDITDQVLFETKFGLLSMAFHPNFNQNGRFFASFNCDKLQHLGCSGRCACNTDVNCDPANLGNDDGILPCQYHNVIAEFSANHTHSKLKQERSANPSEVRRIFTMGIPSHGHAGQILFGPEDGYLYYVVRDGSKNDAPSRFSQSKQSVQGKILRIDVDKLPSAKDRKNSAHMWGNYSIPNDNPWIEDTKLLPEIWALGFHNPWRCSFDSDQPSFFFCGDAGQALFEEVDIITKGGNYGWPIYEGPFLHNQTDLPKTNAIKAILPVMGYNGSDVASKIGGASIIGGYTYRSKTDPCLYGRYLYTDLYANTIWVGTEQPEKSGKFTSKRMAWSCAKDSPLQCNTKPGSHDAAIGYAFSFGEDNRKDVYLLASSGIYRIVHPSRCGFVCSMDNPPNSMSPVPIPSSSNIRSTNFKLKLVVYVFLTYVGYFSLEL